MFKLNDKLFLVLLSSFFLSLFVVLQVYPYLLSLRIEVPILILNTLNTKVVFFIVHHSLSILSHLMSLSVLLITQNSICVSLSLSLSLSFFLSIYFDFPWVSASASLNGKLGVQVNVYKMGFSHQWPRNQRTYSLSLSLSYTHVQVIAKWGREREGGGEILAAAMGSENGRRRRISNFGAKNEPCKNKDRK